MREVSQTMPRQLGRHQGRRRLLDYTCAIHPYDALWSYTAKTFAAVLQREKDHSSQSLPSLSGTSKHAQECFLTCRKHVCETSSLVCSTSLSAPCPCARSHMAFALRFYHETLLFAIVL